MAKIKLVALDVDGTLVRSDLSLSPAVVLAVESLRDAGILVSINTGRSMGDWAREVGGFTAFTGIFNGTGQPSMSLPLAMSQDGMPIGVMATGRFGDEARLFRLAGQVEKAAPWTGRRPRT